MFGLTWAFVATRLLAAMLAFAAASAFDLALSLYLG